MMLMMLRCLFLRCLQGLPATDNAFDDHDADEGSPPASTYATDNRNLLRDFDLVRILCDRPQHFIERMRVLAAGCDADIPMSQQDGGDPAEVMTLVPTSPDQRGEAPACARKSGHL